MPSVLVAYMLAFFRPGLWYFDDDSFVIDLNWLLGVEILEIALFFNWHLPGLEGSAEAGESAAANQSAR